MSDSGVYRPSHFTNSDAAFIGRKRELFALAAALQRARTGDGTIFLLSGAVGTGETSLVSEFSTSRSGQRGESSGGPCQRAASRRPIRRLETDFFRPTE